MTTSSPRAFSDMPVPPGEVLEEELQARGMTQKELAIRLGRPAQAINEVIKGKKAITPDTAIGLAKVLGIEAQFWTNLEATYRMTLARNRERTTLAEHVQWLGHYPVKEMVRRGWLEVGRSSEDKLTGLLKFLGVANLEPRIYQEAVGFRITEAAQQHLSPGALAVWLRKGELDAQETTMADYDEEAFTNALRRIRDMTRHSPEEFVPEMTALCAGSGVAFCLVQELPKTGANGVARWLTDRKALVQMNIRGKWADVFWFTFFHEACHLLRHRKQRRIVVDVGHHMEPSMAEFEEEADRFARDFLIGPEDWSRFCDEGYFDERSVREFSESVGTAPFIVVGRLQKEERIGYNRLTNLKHRYQWAS